MENSIEKCAENIFSNDVLNITTTFLDKIILKYFPENNNESNDRKNVHYNFFNEKKNNGI